MDASMGAVGPWAGALLGQLGADVIKLESPQGDFIRNVMPTQGGLSSTYISMNVSKRGLVLDLKKPDERKEAQALIAGADVFLENFRPGVADRIGLGWEELSSSNPRLIYASASGFGWSGPLVTVGATDPHIQAFTGSTSVNGAPGAPRQRVRWYGHFDVNTSMCIVQGVLTALIERERTGKGRLVRITMVEAAMALQRVRVAEHLAGGHPRPMGSATTYLAPDRLFRALDGFVAVSVTSQHQWQGFCAAIERPELAEDPRFSTNAERVANRDALDALLDPVFASRSIGHWVRTMERNAVPVAKPSSFDDFRHHSHYRENGMLVDVAAPTRGQMTLSGTPWKFARNPGEVRRAPLPGEHSRDIRANGWGGVRPVGAGQ
ncbi:CoA transferase [Alsobacter sp. SYSU M60028]|uniref:CoA transferase n=1 Tax=Alsobacter ponti TaxID=2962936 RepID=A0ABT1LCU9_9HYPH|nr:CoA transferase [Alsobacter ponti]